MKTAKTLAKGAGWRMYQDARTARLVLELKSPGGAITLVGWNGETLGVLETILVAYHNVEADRADVREEVVMNEHKGEQG